MSKPKQDNLPKPVVASEVVQMSLFPETVEALESAVISVDELFTSLASLAEEGYSFSVLYDFKRKLYSARLAGVFDSCLNAEKLLYGNGDTLELAVLSLYGKHFLQSGGKTWVATATSGRRMS